MTTAIKLKNDAYKLLRLYRRPLPRIRKGIGTWERVIQVLGFIGVGTNTGLVLYAALASSHGSPLTAFGTTAHA